MGDLQHSPVVSKEHLFSALPGPYPKNHDRGCTFAPFSGLHDGRDLIQAIWLSAAGMQGIMAASTASSTFRPGARRVRCAALRSQRHWSCA